MAQASGSYSHRSSGASASAHDAGGLGTTRLNDLLQYVKHEVDAIHSESSTLKMQNSEYDAHAASHSQEISALRMILSELEKEHDKLKHQYEDENRRLRQELDAANSRSGNASNGGGLPTPVLPPPQVGHGPANLFGGIMGTGSSSATSNGLPTQPQSLPGVPQTDGGGTIGWDTHRDREGHSSREHPSKRMRMDDGKTAHRDGQQSTPGTPGGPESGIPRSAASPAPSQTDGRPGPLSMSRAGGPSMLSATDSKSPPAPFNGEKDNTEVQRGASGATEWIANFNPQVKRELAIELLHTLQHKSVVCCVRFSPDGQTLAAGCNRDVVLYDTQTGNVQTNLTDASNGSADNFIRSACFSPNGQLLATGAENHLVRVWDIKQEKILQTFEGHRSEIYCLAFSPDGQLLASGSGDRSAYVWDMETGEKKFSLAIDHVSNEEGGADAGVTSIAISADGALVAAGSLDQVVRVWDLKSGDLLDRLRGHKDSVYSVCFSPDGKWLVSGSLDRTLKVWDLDLLRKSLDNDAEDSAESKGSCIATLNGHKDYVLSVAITPDGRWIVSGSKDRGVSFWDPKATHPAVVLQGHKNSVISIAVSDVGDLLATGSGDWTSKIWRIKKMPSEPSP